MLSINAISPAYKHRNIAKTEMSRYKKIEDKIKNNLVKSQSAIEFRDAFLRSKSKNLFFTFFKISRKLHKITRIRF